MHAGADTHKHTRMLVMMWNTKASTEADKQKDRKLPFQMIQSCGKAERFIENERIIFNQIVEIEWRMLRIEAFLMHMKWMKSLRQFCHRMLPLQKPLIEYIFSDIRLSSECLMWLKPKWANEYVYLIDAVRTHFDITIIVGNFQISLETSRS